MKAITFEIEAPNFNLANGIEIRDESSDLSSEGTLIQVIKEEY